MTRLLFLDIDGVLNNRAWLARRPTHELDSELDEIKCNLDPAPIARLNRVVRDTGCLLVLSSSWRCLNPLPMISQALRETGLETDLIGATPELGVRGVEIRAWLDASRLAADFLIVDDEDELGALSAHLVRTSYETGLLDAHADEIVARFERYGAEEQ